MRIISGKYKGRNICAPKEETYRPTTGQVKEALFSSLDSLVSMEGLSALDMFAGSGALGFEALSRGAKFCGFVEKNRKLCEAVTKTATHIGVEPGEYVVLHNSVLRVLKEATLCNKLKDASPNGSFDVVFCDPPYEEHPGALFVEALIDANLLSPGAIIAVESKKQLSMPQQIKARFGGASLVREKVYGITMLRFYEAHCQKS